MGLDMYIEARRFTSKYFEPELAAAISKVITDWPIEPAKYNSESYEVSASVCYWRKANQIHNWFVQNVQRGQDECLPHYVSLGTLRVLRDLCRSLLEKRDPAEAARKLPPASGFFFGSTEIDDWYWQDLENTDQMLTELLDSPSADKFEYVYRSSW